MLGDSLINHQDEVREGLKQPFLVIQDALRPDFAERLYDELVKSDLWFTASTDIDENKEFSKKFRYQRDHIDATNPTAPDSLREFNSILNSQDIRSLFSDLSGNRCDLFRASATIFNNGDHISRHNDRRIYKYKDPVKPNYARTLTFNYYLSKNWNSDWGGNFIWETPRKVITPSFNTLVMFNVSEKSYHWVEPVTCENCDATRLSITGWFLTEIDKRKFSLNI